MRKTAFIVLTVILIAGCVSKKPAAKPGEGAFVDRHMENVTQLTFDGDNGEGTSPGTGNGSSSSPAAEDTAATRYGP